MDNLRYNVMKNCPTLQQVSCHSETARVGAQQEGSRE